MRDFITWLEQQNNIAIDTSAFKNALVRKSEELLDYLDQKQQRLSGFQLNWNYLNKEIKDYPNKQNLLDAITKKEDLYPELREFYKWIENIRNQEWEERKQSALKGIPKPATRGEELYKLYKHLRDYSDSLENTNIEEERKYYQLELHKIFEQTEKMHYS